MSSIQQDRLKELAADRWERFIRLFDDLDALRQRLDYQTYILAVVGLVSSLVLGFGDLSTKTSIAHRQDEDLQATLEQVLPSALHDNELLHDVKMIGDGKTETPVYIARKEGKVTAVAFKYIATGGYSGPISLVMGVDSLGNVLGVRVVAHAETPGLGDKIETSKSDWILSFNKKSLENLAPERWKVKKDGGDFDQFAGATITPRAVVRGVESGLKFFRANREALLN